MCWEFWGKLLKNLGSVVESQPHIQGKVLVQTFIPFSCLTIKLIIHEKNLQRGFDGDPAGCRNRSNGSDKMDRGQITFQCEIFRAAHGGV
jgi:hypothetical protein